MKQKIKYWGDLSQNNQFLVPVSHKEATARKRKRARKKKDSKEKNHELFFITDVYISIGLKTQYPN